MTTVYIGTLPDHPLSVFGPRLEPLAKHLREHYRKVGSDVDNTMYLCPAFTDAMKNTFVVPAPVDLECMLVDGVPTVRNAAYLNDNSGFGVQGKNYVSSQPTTNNVGGFSKRSLQLLHDNYMFPVADAPTKVWYSPPFLHESPINGFFGVYDISKWARPLGFVVNVDRDMVIKEGEPLAYLRFETQGPLTIKYSTLSDRFLRTNHPALLFKNIRKNRPLQHLYERFAQSGKMKTLLRELADNVYREQ
jgi:hypothetical protein